MKIKTSELEGAALDWAVAKVVGVDVSSTSIPIFCPSTNWSQGGPLIERYYIDIESGPWSAYYGGQTMHGDSPLIAACRAIVAAKLGDVVEVPEELA